MSDRNRTHPVTSSITDTNTGLAPRSSTSPSMGRMRNRGRVARMISSTSRRPSGGLPQGASWEIRAAMPRKNSMIMSRMSRQYTTHTAMSVAKWSRMLYRASGSVMPKKYWSRDRCPELEMGRNSATPCTTPSTIAIQNSNAVTSLI